MRDKFYAYYRPSNDEHKALWGTCIFVLDANVLLNLYRYSATGRTEFLDVLTQLKDRLWVPHQAALEYHQNRLKTITDLYNAYEKFQTCLEGFEKQLQSLCREHDRHPFIPSELLSQKISDAVLPLSEFISSCKATHDNEMSIDAVLETDDVLESLSQLLDGKVGDAYSEDQLTTLYEQARHRYEKQIPPGYRDKSKDEPRRYGDFVLWRQILDEAHTRSAPVILITDDTKEDWWREHKGRTVGPRPELIIEMHEEAGTQFYMYSSRQFLKWAKDWQIGRVSDETIQEVSVVGKALPESMPSKADYEFLLDTPIAIELASNLEQLLHRRQAVMTNIYSNTRRLTRLEHIKAEMEHEFATHMSKATDIPKQEWSQRTSELDSLFSRITDVNHELDDIHVMLSDDKARLDNLDSQSEDCRRSLDILAGYNDKQQTLWTAEYRRRLREQQEHEPRVLRSADRARLEELRHSRNQQLHHRYLSDEEAKE